MTEYERRQRIERLQQLDPPPTRQDRESISEKWPPADCELPSLDTLERLSRPDIADQARECRR